MCIENRGNFVLSSYMSFETSTSGENSHFSRFPSLNFRAWRSRNHLPYHFSLLPTSRYPNCHQIKLVRQFASPLSPPPPSSPPLSHPSQFREKGRAGPFNPFSILLNQSLLTRKLVPYTFMLKLLLHYSVTKSDVS